MHTTKTACFPDNVCVYLCKSTAWLRLCVSVSFSGEMLWSRFGTGSPQCLPFPCVTQQTGWSVTYLSVCVAQSVISELTEKSSSLTPVSLTVQQPRFIVLSSQDPAHQPGSVGSSIFLQLSKLLCSKWDILSCRTCFYNMYTCNFQLLQYISAEWKFCWNSELKIQKHHHQIMTKAGHYCKDSTQTVQSVYVMESALATSF